MIKPQPEWLGLFYFLAMTCLNMECDKFVWNKFEQPKAGPKGVGQDARSNVGHCQALNNEIPGSKESGIFLFKI